MKGWLALVVGLLVTATGRAEVPKDGWLVWMSNRSDGRHEVYLSLAGTGKVTRLTYKGGEDPCWSPDGRWIAYHHTSDDTTHVLRADRSEEKQVCAGAPEFWMHDGSGLLCSVGSGWGGKNGSYTLVHPDTGAKQLLFRKNDFAQLKATSLDPGGITRDGRWMVAWVWGLFSLGYTADNGTFKSPHATVLLDLKDKSKLYFFGPGCSSATPPSGDLAYHVSRQGATMPDIFKMSVKDYMSRSSYALELGSKDADWGHEYMPSISTDGKWLAYAASTGCHDWWTCDYEIFVHRLGAGPTMRQRITYNKANDGFPSLYVGERWSKGQQQDGGGSDAVAGDGGGVDAGDGPAEPKSGCSCTTPASSGPSWSASLLLLLLLLLPLRCRAAPRRGRGACSRRRPGRARCGRSTAGSGPARPDPG